MAKIQIIRGSYDETCTKDANLVENQIKFPEINDVIMYSEQRMISTLIVSGVKTPYQAAPGNMDVPTEIKSIPQDKLIGSNGYQYRVWGRIQKSSVINHQVGASGADGTFSLSLKDNYLTPGMNVVFHDQTQARVMSAPTGGAGNYVYSFQTIDGAAFVYATSVTPQSGEKTVFGGFTSFGEASLRGFSRSHYPDMFINHTTIQRKSTAISGSAASSVIWLEFNGVKGWMHEGQRQARVQFMLEDEHAKFWGRSTMKNADGSLRTEATLFDSETGNQIVQGDGIEAQIEGINDTSTSGVNGRATIDDFKDMMSTLKKKANNTSGNRWYVVTGADGMKNAQEVLATEAITGATLTQNINSSNKVGGPDVEVGYNFQVLNFDGNQIVFVEHPLMDDEQRWTERASNGELVMSGTYYFLDLSNRDGQKNIEILGRGAYGNNRTMVSGTINGLSGIARKMGVGLNTSVDADEFHMLKEDGIFIYNTASCGILRRSAS